MSGHKLYAADSAQAIDVRPASSFKAWQEPAASLTRLGSEVRIENVSRKFGNVVALDDVSLAISPGEFVTLLGPSGSGKTTLLGAIAGFQNIDAGRILVGGESIQGVPPHRRGFGMVFQSYALFPHMTVAQNVGFPLRMEGTDRESLARRVGETLDILKLGSLANRLPAQLSGGQQQRVAIARAIVKRPKVVLMDEPLSALDRRLREDIQLEIRDLHRKIGTTIIFVTHDQTEALAMSDRIAVLESGRIVQYATPSELYNYPANDFVAGFVGESNRIAVSVIKTGERLLLQSPSGFTFPAARGADGLTAGSNAKAVVRPERIIIGPPGTGLVDARVVGTVNLGEIHRIDAMVAGGETMQIRCLDAAQMPDVSPGAVIGLSWSADDCWVIA